MAEMDKATEKKSRFRRRSKGRGADLDPPHSSSADLEERIQAQLENSRALSRQILEMTSIWERTRAEGLKKARDEEMTKAAQEARQVCRDRYAVNIGHNGDVYPIGYHRSRTQDALDNCLEIECQAASAAALMAKNSHGDRGPFITHSKGFPFEKKMSMEVVPPSMPSMPPMPPMPSMTPGESFGRPYKPRMPAYREDRDGCPECKEPRPEASAKEPENKTQGEIYQDTLVTAEADAGPANPAKSAAGGSLIGVQTQSSHENVQRWLEGIRHHYGFPDREEDEKEVAAYSRHLEQTQGENPSTRELRDRPHPGRFNTSSKIDASNNLATFRSTFDVSDYTSRDYPPVAPRDTVSNTDRTYETGRMSARESVNEMIKKQDVVGGGAIGGGGDVTSTEGDKTKEGEEEPKDKEEGAKAKEGEEGEAGATGMLARKHSLKAVVKKIFLCCSRPPKGEDFEKEKEEEKDEKKDQEPEENEEKEKKEEKEEEEEV